MRKTSENKPTTPKPAKYDRDKYVLVFASLYALTGLVASAIIVLAGGTVPESIIATVSLSVGHIVGAKTSG